MTPAFNNAVLDTLLPGDAVLPAATQSSIDAAAVVAGHMPVFKKIAEAAGSEEAFVAKTADARAEVLQGIDRGPNAPAFKAMVAAAIHDYYTSDTVLRALGWRQGPPQPAGHKLIEADEATWQRLEKVRRRPRLWR
jgi:hypothetical protein